MGRNPPVQEVEGNGGIGRDGKSHSNANGNTGGANNADLGFHSIRDRFPFKRNSSQSRDRSRSALDRPSLRNRPTHGTRRKGLLSLLKFRGACLFYLVILFAVFAFVMSSLVMQSSITSLFGQGGERRKPVAKRLRLGSTLKFVPARVAGAMDGGRLDRLRSEFRIGVRAPRLALILGNMKKDPWSLMLFTLVKNLQKLGYEVKIFAVDSGEACLIWEKIAGYITVLGLNHRGHIDWTKFEGIVADSLEAKDAISSLMQEPFSSVPLLWIIHEDILALRLSVYEEWGQDQLVSHWKSAFSWASAVIFPDFTLPMLYSVLDDGNFYVISGSPADAWAVESYSRTHDKHKLREAHGFSEDDMIVVVVGSAFFFDGLSWDYAVAMHTLGPLLTKYGRRRDGRGSFKFVFLCGNSTGEYDDSLQEVASRLGLAQGTIRHFGLSDDVDGVLMMADILIYGSSQEEQGFPALVIRAMAFGIPILSPEFPTMKKYIVDGTHGNFFPRHDPDALLKSFSLLVSDGSLSRYAQTVASSGQLLAKNIMASECITSYATLLENTLNFPSGVMLPDSSSNLQDVVWEWNLFRKEIGQESDDIQVSIMAGPLFNSSRVVYDLEEKFVTSAINSRSNTENQTDFLPEEIPSELDWKVVSEIEEFEEYERVETEELEERAEKDTDDWDEIYRNARKSEKLRFEANERDEGELERTGQPVCIYEIYTGTGAWPFLHHGSLYRGLSLSPKARRLSSDDVDAVGRLSILNDTYYRDMLCEMGGMFSIANKVDGIHMRPWIGFQSWRAAGSKISLSAAAEKVLEEVILQETMGDVIYFWVRLDLDNGSRRSNSALTFWSICDILNGGNCRTVFRDSFRHMYGLPSHVEALPPMPEDGHRWSALHSWVMPTPSFLEFVMFSRMFSDSLDALHNNSTKSKACLLGSSELETAHCYCRLLELLVNVWAYHSGRRMVYIDPRTGSMEEQHHFDDRKGFMWAKYFNFSLLKSMDEDLAEAADDGDHPRDSWLWPLTGEVHWQGVYEREREERYRLKMDKKRKTKEKLYERMKFGYKQKSLG